MGGMEGQVWAGWRGWCRCGGAGVGGMEGQVWPGWRGWCRCGEAGVGSLLVVQLLRKNIHN